MPIQYTQSTLTGFQYNKELYLMIGLGWVMVKLDGRGDRVNNSLGASQFSRHLSLNRESRQPVCASSSPLKHSTYTSVSHYNDCFMR